MFHIAYDVIMGKALHHEEHSGLQRKAFVQGSPKL